MIGTNGGVIDFGTKYMQYSKFGVVRINVLATRPDTLFVGASGDIRTIYPLIQGKSEVLVFSYTLGGSAFPYNNIFGIRKAFGQRGYDSVKSIPSAAIIITGGICDTKDTADIYIN